MQLEAILRSASKRAALDVGEEHCVTARTQGSVILEEGEGSRRRPVLADVDAIGLAEILVDLLDEHVDDLDDAGLPSCELTGAEAETFADARVLAGDAGFVVTLADGSEFQLTVIQTKR